jgi:hypothetical protein
VRGCFYHNAWGAYFLFHDDKRLIEISPESDEMRLHLANYGLNSTETIQHYVTEALWIEAWANGTKTEIHRFCYYNQATFTLYLSNQSLHIYRVTPETVELVDNGTDGVLFLFNRKNVSFVVGERDTSVSWLDRIIISQFSLSLNP